MRLADLEVEDVIAALRKERSAWIDAAQREGRRETEAEKVTICILAALERVLAKAHSST